MKKGKTFGIVREHLAMIILTAIAFALSLIVPCGRWWWAFIPYASVFVIAATIFIVVFFAKTISNAKKKMGQD